MKLDHSHDSFLRHKFSGKFPLKTEHKARPRRSRPQQRCLCPSCHQKRTLLTAETIAQTIFAPAPHRQLVFTIPKRLRVFCRHDRSLLGKLARAAWQATVEVYRQVLGRRDVIPGMVAGIRVSENDKEIVLRNLAMPKPMKIRQSDVEDVIESKTSLMPENLTRQLKSRSDFNDLMKYIIEIRKR